MSRDEGERRATRRWSVGLVAECKQGKEVQTGIVRDLTDAGAFVASGRERPAGASAKPSGLPRGLLLEVGDRFLLTLVRSTVTHRRTMRATVCWQGRSTEHGCHGYGVQYDAL